MTTRANSCLVLVALLCIHAVHAGAGEVEWQTRKVLVRRSPSPPPPPPPPSPPPPSPPPPALQPVINFYQWKLQEPIGPVGSPLSYYGAALAALNDTYFQQTPTGILFYTPTSNCTTTSGSKYCRSELREMTLAGSNAAWNMGDGLAHVMTVRQQVRSIPAVKPWVVVAQIHNSTDDVIEVRCKGAATDPPGNTTQCILEVFHNSVIFGVLDPTYTLNTNYTLALSVTPGGNVSVAYDNGTYNSTVPCVGVPPDTTNCYFKTGAYSQSNEYPSVGTSVFLYNATIQHGP